MIYYRHTSDLAFKSQGRCKEGFVFYYGECVLAPGYYLRKQGSSSKARACPASTCSWGAVGAPGTLAIGKGSCSTAVCDTWPSVAGRAGLKGYAAGKPFTLSTAAVIKGSVPEVVGGLFGGFPSPKTRATSISCDTTSMQAARVVRKGRKLRFTPQAGYEGPALCSLQLAGVPTSIHFELCLGNGCPDPSAGSSVLGAPFNEDCDLWDTTCPAGRRCIEVKNSCDSPITLGTSNNCKDNGSGCNYFFVHLANLANPLRTGQSIFLPITNLAVPPPPCWTKSFNILTNKRSDCVSPYNCLTCGTRLELTAGNSSNNFAHNDQYNIDVENTKNAAVCTLRDNDARYYSIPALFQPSVPDKGGEFDCGVGIPGVRGGNLCRPLYCNNKQCADAYCESTTGCGGCPESTGITIPDPQAACPQTFQQNLGFTIELCPTWTIPSELQAYQGSCRQRCCCNSAGVRYNSGMVYPTAAQCTTLCASP